jgi:hypothetical protein
MSNGTSSNFETVVKWVIVVIVAIVALKIIATVLGIAFVLGGFLFFRVLPLVLLAWLVYMVIQWLTGKNKGTSSTSSTMDI